MYLVENEADVQALNVANPAQLAYVTQTTLSMDDTAKVITALRQKFPEIKGPRKDDICYATQNRQDAVKVLADQCDLVLVVGSVNSSNSNRLRELAERTGTEAYLVRQCRRCAAAMAAGQAVHRCNRWRFGSRCIGSGRHSKVEIAWCTVAAGARWQRRKYRLQYAQRVAFKNGRRLTFLTTIG